MLTSLFAQYGKWLILLGIILFVIALFKAIRAGRRARAASYYAIRQEALSRTRRWAFITVVLAVATIVVAAFLPRLPVETAAIASTSQTPTLPVASIATRLLPTPQPTDTATIPPSPIPTPVPSQTPTLVPTPTLPPNLPAILLTPVSSAVPPAANAKLNFTTLASIVQNNNPIDPGLAFPAGTRTVRLFFRASNVNNGAAWSVLCYKGDKIVDSVVALWKWGTRPQTARAFCGLDGSAGDYRIETYLGPVKQFEVGFELLPPTPTPTSS